MRYVRIIIQKTKPKIRKLQKIKTIIAKEKTLEEKIWEKRVKDSLFSFLKLSYPFLFHLMCDKIKTTSFLVLEE